MSLGEGWITRSKGRLCKEATVTLVFSWFTRTLCSTLLYLPLLNICDIKIKKTLVYYNIAVPALNHARLYISHFIYLWKNMLPLDDHQCLWQKHLVLAQLSTIFLQTVFANPWPNPGEEGWGSHSLSVVASQVWVQVLDMVGNNLPRLSGSPPGILPESLFLQWNLILKYKVQGFLE